MGAPRDGSPEHMSSLYPLPSWLAEPTVMPAGFFPAAARSRLAQAGWLCGISRNCLHFDVRNLLPEGYLLPAANLRLASGC